MTLWALACHYELSDDAVRVCLALSLGFSLTHARFLKEQVAGGYENSEECGDSLHNQAKHGFTTCKATHDRITAELASIATCGGVPSTAVERKIPFLMALPGAGAI
jgi:hypothetical protein